MTRPFHTLALLLVIATLAHAEITREMTTATATTSNDNTPPTNAVGTLIPALAFTKNGNPEVPSFSASTSTPTPVIIETASAAEAASTTDKHNSTGLSIAVAVAGAMMAVGIVLAFAQFKRRHAELDCSLAMTPPLDMEMGNHMALDHTPAPVAKAEGTCNDLTYSKIKLHSLRSMSSSINEDDGEIFI